MLTGLNSTTVARPTVKARIADRFDVRQGNGKKGSRSHFTSDESPEAGPTHAEPAKR